MINDKLVSNIVRKYKPTIDLSLSFIRTRWSVSPAIIQIKKENENVPLNERFIHIPDYFTESHSTLFPLQRAKKFGNRMKRLLKLTNLNQGLTPHSFRHTHTSLLAEAGVGLIEIKDV